MASYELTAFDSFSAINLVAAIDYQAPSILNIGYWLQDPNQMMQWPSLVTAHPRQDFLWQDTCFEIFIGVNHDDFYREINLSPSQAWQAYQFEEYRYPENMPPDLAKDIELVQLKRTHYGLNVTLDISAFMQQNQLKPQDLYVGLAAILNTTQGLRYYAMQHSSPMPDFHNKRDWLYQL